MGIGRISHGDDSITGDGRQTRTKDVTWEATISTVGDTVETIHASQPRRFLFRYARASRETKEHTV